MLLGGTEGCERIRGEQFVVLQCVCFFIMVYYIVLNLLYSWCLGNCNSHLCMFYYNECRKSVNPYFSFIVNLNSRWPCTSYY